MNRLGISDFDYSPYLELALCAKSWGADWPKFKKYDGETKAEMLEAYRYEKIQEAISALDRAEEIKKQNNQNGLKKNRS